MQNLKILQLTTFYAPVIGGVETQVEDLSHKLVEVGHQVEIITTNSARQGARLPAGTEILRGLLVTRVRTLFSLSQFHKFAPAILQVLWQKDFDLLHTHGLRKPELYLALLVAKLRGKRIVVSTHNPFTTVKRSILLKLFIFCHDITVGILLMRFIDHYFLLTETEKPILRKFGIRNQQMTVVGNAVHPDFLKNFNSEQITQMRLKLLAGLPHSFRKPWQYIVLSVGRLNYIKGFQNIIQAARTLPEVLFIVVGSDDGYAKILAQLFKNETNVYLNANGVERLELIDYLASSDVFLLTSLHEPFGIVILEAMAQGCAIVATNSDGPASIVQDKGLLVEVNDPRAISNALQQLLSNPQQLQELQMLARSRAGDYTWERILPLYLDRYQ